jgi:hypothetical protein
MSMPGALLRSRPVADGRGRELQAIRRPADVTLFQHHLEQDEKVQVSSGKVNIIQHIAEIISFDSLVSNCDLAHANQNKEPACQRRLLPP